MRVEILNWDKHNPRKDLKSTSWFRFSNSFWVDQKYYKLDSDDFVVWVIILSIASQKQNAIIDIEPEFLERVRNIKKEKTLEAIKKFANDYNLVHIRHAHVTHTSRTRHAHVPLQNITEQNTTNITEHNRTEYNIIQNAKPIKTKKSISKVKKPDLGETSTWLWIIWKDAYLEKYKTEPPRNKEVNSMLKRLIEKCGKDWAGEVLLWFLKKPNSFYTTAAHSLALAMRDYQALLVEVKRKKPIGKDAKADLYNKHKNIEAKKEQIDLLLAARQEKE